MWLKVSVPWLALLNVFLISWILTAIHTLSFFQPQGLVSGVGVGKEMFLSRNCCDLLPQGRKLASLLTYPSLILCCFSSRSLDICSTSYFHRASLLDTPLFPQALEGLPDSRVHHSQRSGQLSHYKGDPSGHTSQPWWAVGIPSALLPQWAVILSAPGLHPGVPGQEVTCGTNSTTTKQL